jgi:hypothetical protein
MVANPKPRGRSGRSRNLTLDITAIAVMPVGAAVAQLAAHDLTNAAEHRPLNTMASKIGLGVAAISATKRGFRQGVTSGKAALAAEVAEKRRTSISIPRAELGANSQEQLSRDLATLAGDERTALRPTAKMPPASVAAQVDAAFKRGGENVEINLATVGIRASKNLIRALNEYGKGGREELVAAGLLRQEAELNAGRAGNKAQTKGTGRQRDGRGI